MFFISMTFCQYLNLIFLLPFLNEKILFFYKKENNIQNISFKIYNVVLKNNFLCIFLIQHRKTAIKSPHVYTYLQLHINTHYNGLDILYSYFFIGTNNLILPIAGLKPSFLCKREVISFHT